MTEMETNIIHQTFPSNLSDEQTSKVKQFRESVSDVLRPEHDNFFLVKWLRARNFDLKKAEDMIRKSMAWREMWNVDNILTDWNCPEVIQIYDVGGMCGYDKEISPIWIYKSAKLDMKGIAMSAKRSDIIKRYIWKMETNAKEVKDQSLKLGRRVDQAVMIADLEGYTMRHLLQPGMDVILKILALVEANYPENLKKAYVINAPTVFPLIFKICKPFMSEDTKRKVTILGSNWKEDLLKVIDADQLPVHWGGTKVDPADQNPECSSLVRMGGKVPSSYFLKGNDLVDKTKVKKISVNSGQVITLESVIDKDNVSIRYTFWTENHDVKFGISFKKTKSSKEEVLKKCTKVSCHMVPEEDVIQCSQQGIYLFHFDNSYSWFHGKDISYVIEVLDPEVMTTDNEHTCQESSEVHLQESNHSKKDKKTKSKHENSYECDNGYKQENGTCSSFESNGNIQKSATHS